MTSSGNIPWLPIRRYINRMQQSYLLLSTPYIFIPSHFISLLTFPSYNSSNYFIHSSFHIYIQSSKNIFQISPPFPNQIKSKQIPSSADYNNWRPQLLSARKKTGKYAVRINDFHREKGDISGRNRGAVCMCTTFELSADRGEGERGRGGRKFRGQRERQTLEVGEERHPQIKRWRWYNNILRIRGPRRR